MAVVNKILVTLAALCLVALAINYSFTALLASPSSINETLRKGGVYEQLAPQVADIFVAEIKSNNASAEQLVTAVKQAIKAPVVEASLQPTVYEFTEWLKASGYNAAPELSADMSPIKTALTTELEKNLPADQVDAVRFEITRSVPDQLKLSDIAQDKTPDGSGTGPLQSSLLMVRDAYRGAQSTSLMLVGAAAGLLLLLALLNIRQGRKRLTEPAWAFFVAAIFGLLVAYGLPIVFSLFSSGDAKNTKLNTAQIGGNISAVLGSMLWPYIIGFVVVGTGLVFAAFLLIHPKDKKH
ncbi:hypothetical protein IT414_03510 [bacterium]|nr:hypothetical protein [bacterium]